MTVNFLKRKMKEYDEIINDDLTIKENNEINNMIKKSKIGHNSSPFFTVEENKERTKPLFKTIEVNIKRRTVIVDDILSYHKGKPIPSWIELSIIDVCNRSCSFLPKVRSKSCSRYLSKYENVSNK